MLMYLLWHMKLYFLTWNHRCYCSFTILYWRFPFVSSSYLLVNYHSLLLPAVRVYVYSKKNSYPTFLIFCFSCDYKHGSLKKKDKFNLNVLNVSRIHKRNQESPKSPGQCRSASHFWLNPIVQELRLLEYF